MDGCPGGWTAGWELAPRASMAVVLMQACFRCLTALTCIRPACLLARKALGRLQSGCCMLVANGVNEAQRQDDCWCFVSVDLATSALLWLAHVTSTHSREHLEHTGKAAGALCACV